LLSHHGSDEREANTHKIKAPSVRAVWRKGLCHVEAYLNEKGIYD